MYKLLLLIPIYLLFTGCAQQTRRALPPSHNTTLSTSYSLEALDARYQQGY